MERLAEERILRVFELVEDMKSEMMEKISKSLPRCRPPIGDSSFDEQRIERERAECSRQLEHEANLTHIAALESGIMLRRTERGLNRPPFPFIPLYRDDTIKI